MRFKCFARPLLLLPILLLALSAHGATVQTLDGRTLQGRIQLDAGGTFLVWLTNEPPVPVALTNLLRADFSNPTNAALPLNRHLRPLAIDEERGALPEPWENADVGQRDHPGSSVHFHGKFTADAPRGMPAGVDEGFHFIYQSFRGNVEIVARIADIAPRDDKERQAAAGLAMRASVESSVNTVRVTLTGNGSISFRRRATTGGTAATSLNTIRRPDRKPPYWLKLVREENVVSAYHSTDGRRWEFVQQTEILLPERLLVGLLVASRRRDVRGTAEFDHVTVRALEPRARYTPRLVLQDGTLIADHFGVVDDTVVNLSKEKRTLRLLTRHVARLEFRPVEDPESLPAGRSGVLLATGDFVDGDFLCVTNGKVLLNSVLFGQRNYALDRKVTAVLLRDVTPKPAVFEIKTLDGCVWRAKSIVLEEGMLHAETWWMGRCKIPAAELKEIARLPSR